MAKKILKRVYNADGSCTLYAPYKLARFEAGPEQEAQIVAFAAQHFGEQTPDWKKTVHRMSRKAATAVAAPVAEPTKEQVTAVAARLANELWGKPELDLPVLTEGSKALFLALADDAPNWSGTPLFGGNVGGDRSSLGHLTDLKKKGLVETTQDEYDRKCYLVAFTDLGITYGKAYGIEWADANNQR